MKKKPTVVTFWVFGKLVLSLGRDEGLIKSPLKPILASLGFIVQPLWSRYHNWIYAVIIFQQSRCWLPLQELVSLSRKTTRPMHQAGGCTQQLFCFSYPPADEELAWMSLHGTEQHMYWCRCGMLMCLQWAWKLMQLHRCRCLLMSSIQTLQSSPFAAGIMQSLVFTQVKL